MKKLTPGFALRYNRDITKKRNQIKKTKPSRK